jgi:hypothetical protein
MSAGTHANIFGRVCGRACHSRIDDDKVGAVELLAFKNVLKRNRMRLGRIAAHLKNSLGIANIVVAVRHRAIARGIGDPGDRGGMADSCLMIGIISSPECRELAVEVSSLI